MVYTLDQGLFAIGAYGTLLVANGVLYKHLKDFFRKRNFFDVLLGSFVLWGIATLTGLIGHIIVNSQFPQISHLTFPITFAIIFPIFLVQIKLFMYALPQNKRSTFIGIIGAIWILMIGEFMRTLNYWWLLIHPLVLLLLFAHTIFPSKKHKSIQPPISPQRIPTHISKNKNN